MYMKMTNPEKSKYDIALEVIKDYGTYSPDYLNTNEAKELNSAYRLVKRLEKKYRD